MRDLETLEGTSRYTSTKALMHGHAGRMVRLNSNSCIGTCTFSACIPFPSAETRGSHAAVLRIGFFHVVHCTTIIPSRFMLNDSSPNLEHTYTRVGLQLQRAHCWKTDHWTGEHQLWIANDAVTAEQGMEVLEQMPSDYWLSRILEWECKDLGSLWIILF